MKGSLSAELAAAAARLVVEEGMEYGPAKRKAARVLGRGALRRRSCLATTTSRTRCAPTCSCSAPRRSRPSWPRCARVALRWMERLAEFRPHLTGAVWRGTATRLNSVHLQLFCDDSKAAEIALINEGVDYESTQPARTARRADQRAVRARRRAASLASSSTVHLSVLDHDDLRGALKPDASGRTERGDLAALRRLMECGMKRRTWMTIGGVGALAAAAGAGWAWWRNAPRRTRARPVVVALRDAGGRRAEDRVVSRQAVGAQFLGHLVRALPEGNAAARPLPS